MEGLYSGQKGAGLVAFGILTPGKKSNDGKDPFLVRIEIPKLLSFLGYRSSDAFVPGIDNLVNGGYKPEYNSVHPSEKEKALSAEEKISRGKIAVNALALYKQAKSLNDTVKADSAETVLRNNFAYFGYAYLNSPDSIIPNVPLTFYSFHVMVFLGLYFIILFMVILYLNHNHKLDRKRWLLRLSIFTIPLVYIASQAGWIVAEVGRQPWVIQDLLPSMAAVSKIDASSVIITFWLFAIVFTLLLIAEVMIMLKQIKIGPKDGGNK